VDEALGVGQQIASAPEAAHERGRPRAGRHPPRPEAGQRHADARRQGQSP
jgi:hypothetical protein